LLLEIEPGGLSLHPTMQNTKYRKRKKRYETEDTKYEIHNTRKRMASEMGLLPCC